MYSNFKDLLARRASYLAWSVLSRGLAFAATMVWYRHLTYEAFGRFSYLQASSSVLAGIGTFGGDAVLNTIGKRGIRAAVLVKIAGSIWVVGAAVVTPIVAIAICAFTKASLPDTFVSWLLGVAFITQTLSLGLCFGLGKLRLGAVAGIISPILQIIIASFVRAVQEANTAITAYALCIAFGAMLMTIVAICTIERNNSDSVSPHEKGTMGLGKAIMRFGFGSSVISLFGLTSNWMIQTMVVQGKSGFAGNAVFAFGSQFYNVLIFIPVMLGPILLDKMSGVDDSARRVYVRSSFGVALCLGIATIAFLALSSSFCVRFGMDVRMLIVLNLSILASVVQMCKAPFSIYFQSFLTVLPDVIGASVAMLTTFIIYALGLKCGPVDAATVRIICIVIPFAVVVLFYLNNYTSDFNIRTIVDRTVRRAIIFVRRVTSTEVAE